MAVTETEYGPGRTIPHPVMFRVLDSEAEDTTIPEIKVEHKSEFAYYPGCVDYYDVEMQFSHMNYGDTNPTGNLLALRVLAYHGNWFVALPLFALITFYVGTRTPYSTYEYLLNECYQCGKCHTVCPVTKVEDDARGGLNLVYNTFKKQHDGVPLWTCLACDACSAVCPLDIKYSDYILEERAKVHAKMAADGGEREWP